MITNTDQLLTAKFTVSPQDCTQELRDKT
jgi:hypothetical protein